MTRTSKLALGLLSVAVVLSGIAWLLQSDAASDLALALEVQRARVPQATSPPPDISQYRDVVKSLDRAIGIRRRTETSLSRVEGILRTLQVRQQEAEGIARRSRGELRAIAETLGGAGRSGVASVRRLKVLRARLSTSRLVGRLIVRELARLDRRLGPSVGQNP